MYKQTMLGLLVALSVAVTAGRSNDGATDADGGLNQFRPQWRVGDRWMVETRTRPIQERRGDASEAATIRWEFLVAALEPEDVYKIEVRCLLGGPRGTAATVRVDRRSFAVRRIDVKIPVPDGFRTISESYRTDSGQSSPVLGPLSALPLDLPVFLDGGKGMQTFQYKAVAGPTGAKAVGDVGFEISVQQQSTQIQHADLENLLHRELAKDMAVGPAIAVDLKSADRAVRQLWQAGLPWPAFSESGRTQARLVRVIRANRQD